MEERIVCVINEMAEYLSLSQLKRLQEVLLKQFSENVPDKQEILNDEYLRLFLEAKSIEGCSERTIIYYRTTIEHFLSIFTEPIRKITTEQIRKYLVDYQKT